jgi:hypothetical protein
MTRHRGQADQQLDISRMTVDVQTGCDRGGTAICLNGPRGIQLRSVWFGTSCDRACRIGVLDHKRVEPAGQRVQRFGANASSTVFRNRMQARTHWPCATHRRLPRQPASVRAAFPGTSARIIRSAWPPPRLSGSAARNTPPADRRGAGIRAGPGLVKAWHLKLAPASSKRSGPRRGPCHASSKP